MTSKLSSLLRSGLIALGVAVGVSAPAFAVPIAGSLTPAAVPAAQDRGAGTILVQREFRGDGRYSRRGERRYSRRHWDDGYRWRHRRHWDGDRYWRRNWRRYDRGPSIYFGLGIPAYRYYEPRYYAPRYYAPRRVYRGGGSGAHVQWCYNRYRSYRAYDNTFQPYNGPRRQCWSPYS